MATYRIADIPAEYDCKYNILKSRSQKYLTEAGAEKAQKIVVTEEYYASRKERFPTASDEQLEYMGTGTFFYKTLLRFDGMMLHASAVAADGEAYLFSAPSGTGKSTHTALWQELLGKDKVLIINDDKPAIRKKERRLSRLRHAVQRKIRYKYKCRISYKRNLLFRAFKRELYRQIGR